MDYLLLNRVANNGTERDHMIWFYGNQFMINMQFAVNSIEISDVAVHIRKCIEAYSYICYLIDDENAVNEIKNAYYVRAIQYKLQKSSEHEELQELYNELSKIEIHVLSYKRAKGMVTPVIFANIEDERIQQYKQKLWMMDCLCNTKVESYFESYLRQ